jgi:hypothetical protein
MIEFLLNSTGRQVTLFTTEPSACAAALVPRTALKTDKVPEVTVVLTLTISASISR